MLDWRLCELRENSWYAEVLLAVGETNNLCVSDILSFLLRNEGLKHTMRLQHDKQIRRIIDILMLELMPNEDKCELSTIAVPPFRQKRKHAWGLIEEAFDKHCYRSWVFNVCPLHEGYSFPDSSVSLL
jgi:hypothetical protein